MPKHTHTFPNLGDSKCPCGTVRGNFKPVAAIATVDRIQHNGTIVIKFGDIKCRYVGYTTVQAKKQFRAHLSAFQVTKKVIFIDL